MEINIEIPSLDKSVSIEVNPDHTVGSIIESVCEGLGLQEPSTWRIIHHGNEISPNRKIGDTGISAGQTLSLMTPKSGLIEKYATQKFPRRNFLKYGVASIGTLAAIGLGTYTYFQSLRFTNPPTVTVTQTQTLTHTPVPTQTPEYSPTEVAPFDFNVEILNRWSSSDRIWHYEILVSLISDVSKEVCLQVNRTPVRSNIKWDSGGGCGFPTFSTNLTIEFLEKLPPNLDPAWNGFYLIARGGGYEKIKTFFEPQP